MGLEKTLKTLLNFTEIKAVNPKGNQIGIFIGRTVLAYAMDFWSKGQLKALFLEHEVS